MNLNDRISEIIKYSQFSSSEFADEIDVQRSSISHITSGRNKPSLEFITKIKNRFPQISWDWLINGEGEMLEREKKEDEKINEHENPKTASLPDLFSLIEDESIANTALKKDDIQERPELDKAEQRQENDRIIDSQRLEMKVENSNSEVSGIQRDKIKSIVIFYESGKFESFHP